MRLLLHMHTYVYTAVVGRCGGGPDFSFPILEHEKLLRVCERGQMKRGGIKSRRDINTHVCHAAAVEDGNSANMYGFFPTNQHCGEAEFGESQATDRKEGKDEKAKKDWERGDDDDSSAVTSNLAGSTQSIVEGEGEGGTTPSPPPRGEKGDFRNWLRWKPPPSSSERVESKLGWTQAL